jgi:hypothetical protein
MTSQRNVLGDENAAPQCVCPIAAARDHTGCADDAVAWNGDRERVPAQRLGNRARVSVNARLIGDRLVRLATRASNGSSGIDRTLKHRGGAIVKGRHLTGAGPWRKETARGAHARANGGPEQRQLEPSDELVTRHGCSKASRIASA